MNKLIIKEFDARELAPPEPFIQASNFLEQLQPGSILKMRHRRMPFPLFEFAEKKNINHEIIYQKDSDVLIVFYYESDRIQVLESNEL